MRYTLRPISVLAVAVLLLTLAGCGGSGPAGDGTPPATANKDNEAVILRYVELINARKFDELAGILAPDFKLHLGNELVDREQMIPLTRSVFDSFPDFNHTVEDIFSMNDRVALRVTDRGSHQGEFFGVAATGRTFEIGQIAIYRVVDGRVAEVWEQADLAGLLQQIQATPADAAAAGAAEPTAAK